jgi:hypothetical protein
LNIKEVENPDGKLWVSGSLRNNGELEVFDVQVRLTLFDRFGNLIGDPLNSNPIDKINPGETKAFNTIKATILKSNVNSYNLSVLSSTKMSGTTTTLPSSELEENIEVIDVVLSEGPSGEFWIDGKLTNDGEMEVFNVQVRLTLHDRFGNVLDTLNSAPIAELNPGETIAFNKIKSSKLKIHVETYTLAVQIKE